MKNKDGSNCNVRMSAKTSNLKRHWERQHKEAVKWVKEQDMQEVHKKGNPTTSSWQSSLSHYFFNKKVSISMTKEQFKRQIIELVVDDGTTLQLFSLPAFLKLMEELATKLGVSLERHCVRDMVINEADNQKQLLKKILHKKFCNLKMELAQGTK